MTTTSGCAAGIYYVEEPDLQQRVFPQLRMTSWHRSRAFYVDGLGFKVDWEHRFEPGFPVFTQISRDGLSLFLTEHAAIASPGVLLI